MINIILFVLYCGGTFLVGTTPGMVHLARNGDYEKYSLSKEDFPYLYWYIPIGAALVLAAIWFGYVPSPVVFIASIVIPVFISVHVIHEGDNQS